MTTGAALSVPTNVRKTAWNWSWSNGGVILSCGVCPGGTGVMPWKWTNSLSASRIGGSALTFLSVTAMPARTVSFDRVSKIGRLASLIVFGLDSEEDPVGRTLGLVPTFFCVCGVFLSQKYREGMSVPDVYG